MKKIWVWILVLGLLFLSAFGSYNSIVTAGENVNNKWSLIENQLQRRADLIPNLVSTVKGYAKHEEEILKEIAEARARLTNANNVQEKAEASQELSNALSRLLVVVERYPNLKADATFRQLMDELAGTENRIAVARMDYNNAVREYNTKIKTFPAVIVARIFGFKEKEYFKTSESARQVPKVDFSK